MSSANLSQESIKQVLSSFVDDNTGLDLIRSKTLKSIQITDNCISLRLVYSYPLLSQAARIEAQIDKLLKESLGDVTVQCDISCKVHSHSIVGGVKALPNVKNIIAIASGKGGVGKSTTSVNLALALASEGARVGILDADIYGPSAPIMMGLSEAQPETLDKKTIQPVVNYGVQTMSIGYLVDDAQAMVWRGPMASGALQQLLNDTRWQDLDYLIVDLPPGTGDIQLTLAQKVPVTAAIIVTTPQDVALADARKAISMFNKVSVPVLGLVENMSMHICSNCGHEEAIFGHHGGASLADEADITLLGSLPLDICLRADTDEGRPTVATRPEHPLTQRYLEIARKMAAKLSLRDKHQGVLPTITISDD